MDQYIGKVLDGRYEIIERIGIGGMAIVYKARDQRLNRLIAVKILKSDLAQDEDFRRRFNAESQAVAQLSHPNIVSVYDVSRGGDTEYIIMELIDGITLKQYMEKRGQLDWRESLHFITQIMHGLSHAHSRGIVHRDIKPQNIMVLRDGSVKVTDFGIACLENSAQTLTQEALGSVHYISPEQARGDRTDARSDIYSAGVVLYEMLTNRLPFEGDSAVSVAIQHLSSIPLAPREINAEIPKPLELICMKAMAADLDKRYACAEDMLSDLEAFRKNPGVSLDFEMDDLRPEEIDEPTRPLKTSYSGYSSYNTNARSSGGASPRTEQRVRERNTDRDVRETSNSGKKRTGLLVGGIVVGVVVVVLLLYAVFSSMGAKEYTVPSVIGYTVEDAQALSTVADGGFTIKEGGSQPSDEAVGVIISQDPTENTVTKTQKTITVIVSSGKDNGEMINVVDQEVRAAKILLQDLKDKYNLTIETVEEESEDIAVTHVISTDPEAGAPLSDGDTITLHVSKGAGKVTIPDFTTLTIEKATKEAQDTYGLVVKTVNEASEEAAGIVIRQDITALTEVEKGSTITLTVSDGSKAPAETETVNYPCSLPTDRDTVELMVELNGTEVYRKTVDCSLGSVNVTLTGSGTGQLSIYWDGVLHEQQLIPFTEE